MARPVFLRNFAQGRDGTPCAGCGAAMALLRFLGAVAIPLVALACTAETKDDGGNAEPGLGAPADGERDDSKPTSCSCSVSVNGEKKVIQCGEEACVGGQSHRCGDGAKLS